MFIMANKPRYCHKRAELERAPAAQLCWAGRAGEGTHISSVQNELNWFGLAQSHASALNSGVGLSSISVTIFISKPPLKKSKWIFPVTAKQLYYKFPKLPIPSSQLPKTETGNKTGTNITRKWRLLDQEKKRYNLLTTQKGHVDMAGLFSNK